MPASSRSLMYRLQAGFAVECIRALTSGGHYTCHTSDVRFAVPDVHTPPAPRRHAYVYPKYVG
eukprot:13357210-Ditylum_brightwellii.AAC.1